MIEDLKNKITTKYTVETKNELQVRPSSIVPRPFLLLITYSLFLIPFSSFSQEKESTDIHKTRSSAIIGGQKYHLHTVEKGQTLFAIAKFYGKDVNDVVLENPEAIDGIKPGQVLKILVDKKPVALTTTDTSNFITHKVEQGQTLYSLSKQYGISVEKLKTLNPQLSDGLKVGQVLKIPSNKPKPATVTPVKKMEVPAKATTATGKATGAAITLPLMASKANPILLNTLKNFGVGAFTLSTKFMFLLF